MNNPKELICPILESGRMATSYMRDSREKCIGDVCAWWVDNKKDELKPSYEGCAIQRLGAPILNE